jgi:integrase
MRRCVHLASAEPLRFHDLRHTFGSLAINKGSLVQVQHWLGHADIETTARYLHHKRRRDEAQLLAGAFRPEGAEGDAAFAWSREDAASLGER